MAKTIGPLESILEFTLPALPLLPLAIALGLVSGPWFWPARRLRLYSFGQEGGLIPTEGTRA